MKEDNVIIIKLHIVVQFSQDNLEMHQQQTHSDP